MGHTLLGGQASDQASAVCRPVLAVGVGQIIGKTPNRVSQNKGHDTATSTELDQPLKAPSYSHSQNRGWFWWLEVGPDAV